MNRWIIGTRPRTLSAAVIPVIVGTAAADVEIIWWRAIAAFLVALFLQIATNFSCLLYTSPSPRDVEESRMPSSA